MTLDPAARLAPLDPGHPQAQRLIGLSEAYMSALYPAESNHFEPADGLRPPQGCFYGLWRGEQLVGCGGAKLCEGRCSDFAIEVINMSMKQVTKLMKENKEESPPPEVEGELTSLLRNFRYNTRQDVPQVRRERIFE